MANKSKFQEEKGETALNGVISVDMVTFVYQKGLCNFPVGISAN